MKHCRIHAAAAAAAAAAAHCPRLPATLPYLPFSSLSGTIYSVKPADIKFVLPGGPGSSSADLARVASHAEAAAAEPGLLEVAWELASGSPEVFTVPQMADFLFNNAGPVSCAAALRLLRADRLYFRQAGRSPPMFSPRTAAQVDSQIANLAAEAEAKAAWERFVADISNAAAAARAAKPSEAAWRAGPHAERLAAVDAFARGFLPLACPERSLATKTLSDLGKTPSPQDAADLLQSIGWWHPHVQLNLIAAGVSEHFPDALEVRLCGSGWSGLGCAGTARGVSQSRSDTGA